MVTYCKVRNRYQLCHKDIHTWLSWLGECSKPCRWRMDGKDSAQCTDSGTSHWYKPDLNGNLHLSCTLVQLQPLAFGSMSEGHLPVLADICTEVCESGRSILRLVRMGGRKHTGWRIGVICRPCPVGIRRLTCSQVSRILSLGCLRSLEGNGIQICGSLGSIQRWCRRDFVERRGWRIVSGSRPCQTDILGRTCSQLKNKWFIMVTDYYFVEQMRPSIGHEYVWQDCAEDPRTDHVEDPSTYFLEDPWGNRSEDPQTFERLVQRIFKIIVYRIFNRIFQRVCEKIVKRIMKEIAQGTWRDRPEDPLQDLLTRILQRILEGTVKRILERIFQRILEGTVKRILERIFQRILEGTVKRILERIFQRILLRIVQKNVQTSEIPAVVRPSFQYQFEASILFPHCSFNRSFMK
jgi:hypothetical protein